MLFMLLVYHITYFILGAKTILNYLDNKSVNVNAGYII